MKSAGRAGRLDFVVPCFVWRKKRKINYRGSSCESPCILRYCGATPCSCHVDVDGDSDND